MHFGELLKRFREERQFTLRDLGKLSEVDHAYVYRLETGEKSTPSEDTIKALTKALKLDSRKAHMLSFLAVQEAPSGLVEIVLDEPEHDLADFESVAAMSHRGARPKTRDDWRRLLGMVRGVREEFEKDG
jgi:HTH-type transcriptional regulator, competence development regulator